MDDYRNNLYYWIKRRGYKLYEVADQTAIPQRTLNDYCKGRTAIPKDRLETLASFLECSIASLMDNDLVRTVNTNKSVSQDEQAIDNIFSTSSNQILNNESLKNTTIHAAKTDNFLSSNIKTMNFREEWQYIVKDLVAETQTCLRAMVFDVELTKWWNTIAGQSYMMTNMKLLKKKVPVKRIFLLSSLDTRLRMNALLTAYVHHKIGIDVRVCNIMDFQAAIPFKPDMFSVHDNLFITLYYFSSEKPLTNLLLEEKYISEFSSFYDEIFMDDKLCTGIEAILARSSLGENFFASVQAQLALLQRLEKIESITELARNLQ